MHFITFIARNLLRRRARTTLTVLGIALSVGAMVALLGVSTRFSAAMEESFRGRGVDIVVMARGVIDQLSSDIDEAVIEQIKKIPGVQAVSPGLVDLVEVQTGSGNISVIVQGWPPDNFKRNELQLLEGSWLDFAGKGKVLLGERAAENLKKRVGDTVLLLQTPFEVVGIFNSFVHYEYGGMILPLQDMQELVGRPHSVTGISVICGGEGDKEAIIRNVKERIEALPLSGRKRKGLAANTVSEYLKSAVHLKLVHGMAWLVSVIALLIGTIGMVNTMVMSVLERVQEIGILRAVGWPRSRVVRMVIGESMLLSLFGALVGILGAVLFVKVLTLIPAVSGFIDGKMPMEAILLGLGLTLLMGLIGGAYPAYRAARLAPTEALRHE